MDANFAIGPIDWQLELDQGITEFFLDASFAIRSIDWQLESNKGLCHRTTNRLAIIIRPGHR